ncbi:MAG: NADH-quinone oxidoreductase subunit C [Bacteroidota bacterium]
MLSFAQIEEVLRQTFPEAVILDVQADVSQPWVLVHAEHIQEVAAFLLKDPRFYFDFLNCLSGVDKGEKVNELQVVYHITSLIHEHRLVLKVSIPKSLEGQADYRPTVGSVSHIWRAADWHEREAYDMLGIYFEGHPDLRRILMPEDWPGHPLRKDYENPDTYHNIKVDY